MQTHAIAKRRVRHSRPLLLGGHAAALHLVEQAGTVIFMSYLEDIGVGDISLAEGVMEWRGNEIANGLFNGAGNRFPLPARDRFRFQGIEDQHAFVCHNDTAAENSALSVDRVHVVPGDELPQGSGTGSAIGNGRLRGAGAV